MAKIGTAEVELRLRYNTDDPLLVLAFWHLCIVTGLVVGLLLGVVL